MSRTSPIRVARIIARLNVGGPARHVVWLTEALAPPEFESILVTGRVPENEEDMSEFAAAHGITPIVLDSMSREISTSDVVTILRLIQIFRRFRPDVIHTHTSKAGTVGRIAAMLYRFVSGRRPRVVHTFHGHIFHSYYGPLKTRLFLAIERRLARAATDRIIVLGEQQRAEIYETFAIGSSEQFRIIPLGIDLSPYEHSSSHRSELRDELGIVPSVIVVGIVGRLTEVKNHVRFLDAARNVIHRSPDIPVKFLVIGDGHLRASLEAYAKQIGIESSTQFLGNRNDPERFYPALDILALTSNNEGTPLTILEAMANRVAVVATDVGGVRDLLGPVDVEHRGFAVCARGIRVNPGSAEAFSDALEIAISSAQLRAALGDKGHRHVIEHHSKQRLIDDIRALYRELVL